MSTKNALPWPLAFLMMLANTNVKKLIFFF